MLKKIQILKAEEKKKPTKIKKEYITVGDPIEIPMSEHSMVKVSVSMMKEGEEFHEPVIDFRQYISSEDYTGPTKKGFALSPKQARFLVETLTEMLNEMEEEEKDE